MALNVYLIAFAVAALFLAARKVTRYIAVQKIIKDHGCKPAFKLPQSERILGYGLLRTQQKAAAEKKLLQTSLNRFKDHHVLTFSATIMGNTFLNTIDPENVKAVLFTNFADFGLGFRLKSFGPLLGHGIFTSDGPHWEFSRSLVRPNFTRAQVADLDAFERHIQNFVSRIPKDGSTVDLQTLFFQLTLDSATEFLFGESVNSLTSPEDSEQQKFGKAFDYAQSKLGDRNRFGELLMFYKASEFDTACKTVHDFVDKIVYRTLEKSELLDPERTIDGDGKQQRYVFLNEMAKATRDPKRLRDELLNVLLAGRDTTASLLSHTFFVLARRPDIWNKLQAEVDGLHGVLPDYETLKSMKYLKYLLTESLRLYPVVPGNSRFANKDTIIPRGGGPNGDAPVFVPKGGVVAYNVFSMHRRKDIYGDDAEEFRPERWASEEGLRPGWGYLPFNGGPRVCVGQQFALAEASYTIVRILQEFKGMENRDPSEWVEGLALTLATATGVKVAMIPRWT